MPREIEIKLPVRDAHDMHRRLVRAGFHRSSRYFEDNLVFDTPDRRLRRKGQLLRLREYQGRTILTFKSRAARSRRYKVRAEEEVLVSGRQTMQKILEALGYRVVFRYQKLRTTFRSSREPALHLYSDDTPIGAFLEVEGPPKAIDRVARRLGFRLADYITLTYADLYARFRRRVGKRSLHMLFPPRRRRQP